MKDNETSTEVALSRWHNRLKAPSPRLSGSTQHTSQRSAERPRTVCEAAAELGLSIHTVRAWAAARRIAHIRLGRAIRIPASEIRRVIEQNTVPAIKER